MSVTGINPINSYYQNTIPYYSNCQTAPQVQQPLSPYPQTSQIYNYPQNSIYNTPGQSSASGVNIVIYNPMGVGAPCPMSNTSYTMPPVQNNVAANPPSTPIANSPIANSPIANSPVIENKETIDKTQTPRKKTKNIVKLTDDYIKTLESYLRSPDKNVRKQGVQDLIKRFEEDKTRYENPSLTALLNIALQDPDAHNRMLALSVTASGSAHGDENTVQLLKNLTTSDKLYGQEAKMAANALLKASHEREIIEDDSPDKNDTKKNDNEME